MFAFASIALVMLPALAACLFNAVFRPPQRTVYLAKAAIWFCAAALTALWIKYADDFAQTRAEGLFAIGLRSGFCARKRQMQGANRSKVGHLAGICNAADAALWRKSSRNTKCKQPLNAAAKIEKFYAEQGRWPDSLAAVGVEQEGRPRLYYLPPNPPAQPQPFLFYPAFTGPFGRYFYDFDRRRFEFQPD